MEIRVTPYLFNLTLAELGAYWVGRGPSPAVILHYAELRSFIS